MAESKVYLHQSKSWEISASAGIHKKDMETSNLLLLNIVKLCENFKLPGNSIQGR